MDQADFFTKSPTNKKEKNPEIILLFCLNSYRLMFWERLSILICSIIPEFTETKYELFHILHF